MTGTTLTDGALMDGTRMFEHRISVPLDWRRADDPEVERIEVFAREFVGRDPEAPLLLFLQGGPGGKGVRAARLPGWMGEALRRFRIVMLDQRGTGLSAPLTARTVTARGDVAEQVAHLRRFRADSIVRDAEALRRSMGAASWAVLGQSYGGFCLLTYLSLAPESVDRALFTGGLPPIDGHADRVYRATYRRMAARNAEHFARFPADRRRLDDVVAHVRDRTASGHPERLPDGSALTVPRLQMLGMALGGNTRADSLHFLLEEAFSEGPGALSDTFLAGVHERLSFRANPMYAVMHESIYGQPAEVTDARGVTDWAAERVRDEFEEFSPRAASPLLTGEMILREHITEDPALAPLAETAEALAAVDDWEPLYDADRLGRNSVPAAAAVYTEDVYVDRDLSLATAARVSGLSVWETDQFHHDGLGDDGGRILRELLRRTD